MSRLVIAWTGFLCVVTLTGPAFAAVPPRAGDLIGRGAQRSSPTLIRHALAAVVVDEPVTPEREGWLPTAWTARIDEDVRAEQSIRRALQRPIPIRCVDRPLSEVLGLFAAQVGIPMSLDAAAFKEAGLDRDMRITFSSPPGISARAALGLIFDQLKLTWTYRYETLLITTQETANTQLYTRIYPVADLVVVGDGTRYEADFESLFDLIQTTIRPQSWDTVGGPGSIHAYESSLAMVFYQTRDVHEETEQLLAALRKSRAAQHVARLEDPPAGVAESAVLDAESEGYRPTVRQRTAAGNVPSWQIPRTKDGKPLQVQTTPGRPNIGQGFGGGFGGGGAAF